MGEVTITFMDGTTKHFIDASCTIGFVGIIVYQHKENGKTQMYHYKKADIKSVTYDS